MAIFFLFVCSLRSLLVIRHASVVCISIFLPSRCRGSCAELPVVTGRYRDCRRKCQGSQASEPSQRQSFRPFCYDLAREYGLRLGRGGPYVLPFQVVIEFILTQTDLANLAYFAKKGILLSNHFAATHPSQPNYAAAISGDYFGMK